MLRCLILLALCLACATPARAVQSDPDASELGTLKDIIANTGKSAKAVGEILEETAATAALAENLDDLLSTDPDDVMLGYDRAKRQAKARADLGAKFQKLGKQLKRVTNGITLGTAAAKAWNGDWQGVTEEALKFGIGKLQAPALALATRAVIVVACGATFGLGCVIVTGVVATYALNEVGDQSKEAGAKYVASKIFRRREDDAASCHLRPDSGLCDYLPDDADDERAGQATRVAQRSDAATAEARADAGARGGATGGGSGGAAKSGGGSSGAGGGAPARASYGSSRISAKVGAVVTTAKGGTTAVTDIGVSDGGSSNLSVTAGTVVTNAKGRSAETVIGRGNGVVSTGTVYNQGGTLIVGDNGRSSRNGKLCLRFYANLCIVQLYPRPPKKPCPPPPWMFDGVFCLRPADLQHQVTGKPF